VCISISVKSPIKYCSHENFKKNKRIDGANDRTIARPAHFAGSRNAFSEDDRTMQNEHDSCNVIMTVRTASLHRK